VTTRSALTKRTPVCLRTVNISNLLVIGIEGGLHGALPVSMTQRYAPGNGVLHFSAW
jgi:hypothetical protein